MTSEEVAVTAFAERDLNILRMADDIRQNKGRMDAVRILVNTKFDDLAKISVLLGQQPDYNVPDGKSIPNEKGK